MHIYTTRARPHQDVRNAHNKIPTYYPGAAEDPKSVSVILRVSSVRIFSTMSAH